MVDAGEIDESAPRPGRPRKYASDADRVRAFRARQKEKQRTGDLEAVATGTPTEAVGTLERTLGELRTITTDSLDRFTLAAAQITAALDRLTDPVALDDELRRAKVDLAQQQAAYETELSDLRVRFDAALDDRANADAAVEAVDTELESARVEHAAEIERLTAAHRAELDDLGRDHQDRITEIEADRDVRVAAATAEADTLRTRLTETRTDLERAQRRAETAEQAVAVAQARTAEVSEAAARHLDQVTAVSEQRIGDLQAAGERAAATAAATITRLEENVERERAAAATARQRVDELRDELERSRIDAGRSATAEAELRERLAALQAPPPDAATAGSRGSG